MADEATDRRRTTTLQVEIARRTRAERDLARFVETEVSRTSESDAVFRILVENIREYAIFLLDADGNVATWNAGAQRIKGYSAAEIIGQHFSRFYSADEVRAGKCEHELELAARDGKYEEEGWRIRKDGTRFWANVVITALRDQDDVVLGYAKVTRDLTERRRAEEESTARMAAEQANRAKDEFFAMLGHELRNPLAPIVTALQLIKLRADPSSRKEHEVIERQVAHLMNLVDDLLDVSRIAQGKVELHKKIVDLRHVLASAIEMASPLIERKGHYLDLQPPSRPTMLDADEARLVQVFTNLLTNAAKYTPQGGHIAVTTELTADHVTVSVRDDGCGMDHALVPRVFDAFVQGVQGSDRPAGGLGLGLALVRSLTRLHGGTVEVYSEGLHLGSVFTVRLPLARQETRAAHEALRPEGNARALRTAKRIMVVDDNDDARMLLVDILEKLGHEVHGAPDGLAALALAPKVTPDIAVLDIGLPGMDGYEVAGRLRETLKERTPKLIAVTGYGQEADRQRSRDAGFDRHLVKPVEVRGLLACIAELTHT